MGYIYMKRNKLYSNKQNGFVSVRLTTLQLLKELDLWKETLVKGYLVDVVYLDFWIAFDTVPHRRLIAKLRLYQIDDGLVVWIKKYIHDRRQQVQGTNSFWSPTTNGFPQGSVLSIVLFELHINNLPKKMKFSVFVHADDTKFFQATTCEDDVTTLQDDITKSEIWSEELLLV